VNVAPLIHWKKRAISAQHGRRLAGPKMVFWFWGFVSLEGGQESAVGNRELPNAAGVAPRGRGGPCRDFSERVLDLIRFNKI